MEASDTGELRDLRSAWRHTARGLQRRGRDLQRILPHPPPPPPTYAVVGTQTGGDGWDDRTITFFFPRGQPPDDHIRRTESCAERAKPFAHWAAIAVVFSFFLRAGYYGGCAWRASERSQVGVVCERTEQSKGPGRAATTYAAGPRVRPSAEEFGCAVRGRILQDFRLPVRWLWAQLSWVRLCGMMRWCSLKPLSRRPLKKQKSPFATPEACESKMHLRRRVVRCSSITCVSAFQVILQQIRTRQRPNAWYEDTATE